MDKTNHAVGTCGPYLPFIMAAAANALFIGSHSSIKTIVLYTTSFESIAIMNSLVIILLFAYSLITKQELYFEIKDPYALRLVVVRSILAVSGVLILLYNVNHIPIGLANTLFNTSPIFMHFVEALVYKKKINKIHLMLTLVCFTGVVLIVKPKILFGGAYENEHLSFYIFIGILSALLNSVSYLVVNEIKKTNVSNKTMLNYFLLGSVLLGTIMSNTEEGSNKLQVPIWIVIPLFLGSLCIIFAMNLLYSALYLENPAKILVFGYVGIITSLITDVFFFNEKMDALSMIGIILTSIGLVSKVLVK